VANRRTAGEIMAKPKNDKQTEYEHYAERCLEMAGALSNREDREVLREMTAEWLKLAHGISHPPKPTK
jgi:hypothetical protein